MRGEQCGRGGLKDPRKGVCILCWWEWGWADAPHSACAFPGVSCLFFPEEKGLGGVPCQGAALGLPHLGTQPRAGCWRRRGARSLPPPCRRAGGGPGLARIASVFLFALFLFCNRGPVLNISSLLALKLRRFHCDKRTNSTVCL